MTTRATPDPDGSLLHNLAIPVPCTASWDAMQGNEQVRHCGLCKKNVYNLSAMPQAEAAALLAGNVDGKLCVRFYRRSDGTVMTSDCTASPRAMVRRMLGKVPRAAATVAGAAGAVAVAATIAHAKPDKHPKPNPYPPPELTVTMGAPPALPVPVDKKPEADHEAQHGAEQTGTTGS